MSTRHAPLRLRLVVACLAVAPVYLVTGIVFGLPSESLENAAWVSLPLTAVMAGLLDWRRGPLWGVGLGAAPSVVWLIVGLEGGTFGPLGVAGLLIPLGMGLPAGLLGALLGRQLGVWLQKPPKTTLDRDLGLLRIPDGPPIPFRDIEEVGLLRYRAGAPRQWWQLGLGLPGLPTAHDEEKYQVFLRAGNQRVYLEGVFRSREKAERYATDIRALVARRG